MWFYLGREPSTHLYRFNPYTIPGIFFARSYLAHEVVWRSEVIWKRVLGYPVFPFEQRMDFYLAWKEYGWIQAQKLIEEMHTQLVEREVSLIVLVFPVSDQVNDRYRKLDEAYVLYPQSKIHQICDNRAIPILDLTEAIYTHGGVAFFQDYLHLNAKGNDVVADEIEKYLVDELSQ